MMMFGLRIYMNAPAHGSAEDLGAFYSRRDTGPFYRWKFDKNVWSVARVTAPDSLASEFSAVSWKLVPTALQKSIIEHYQD